MKKANKPLTESKPPTCCNACFNEYDEQKFQEYDAWNNRENPLANEGFEEEFGNDFFDGHLHHFDF